MEPKQEVQYRRTSLKRERLYYREQVRVRRISHRQARGKHWQCYADSGKQYSRRAVKARERAAKARWGRRGQVGNVSKGGGTAKNEAL